MGLRLKFNLVLAVVFLLGLGVSAYVSYGLLVRNARDEVTRNAGLMMETALAMRATTEQVAAPEMQSCVFCRRCAYASTDVQRRGRSTPTTSTRRHVNPRTPATAPRTGRPTRQPVPRPVSAQGLVGELTPRPAGALHARPIQISNPACLTCHKRRTRPRDDAQALRPANGH
jgi:protein-histidine pros-kinase